jgi:Peptide methionine sulfoxide reductase
MNTMKFPRIISMVLASSLATNAFIATPMRQNVIAKSTSSSLSLFGSHCMKRSIGGAHVTRKPFPYANDVRVISTTTSRSMILDRLFGSGGGAMAQGIVYENLDHPGPELANAAKNGQVLTVSERDPNLHIATFAGGCFWGIELAYQRVPGVVYTAVGYTQGKEIGKYILLFHVMM